MGKSLRRSLLMGFFGVLLLVVGGLGFQWLQVRQVAEQPIAFSHADHAGTLALPCTFCHTYAERSPQAGVPTVERCMSCHRGIAIERPEIKKLRQYFDDREPILWRRIYALPDFVYFSHKRHIRGGIECSACHGAVETMAKVRKVGSLQMGWCVTCHRQKGASIDCATCHK